MSFYEDIQAYSEQPITKQLLLDLLKGYKRPDDKIVELMKQDVLVQLKRGFYIAGSKLKTAQPEPFLTSKSSAWAKLCIAGYCIELLGAYT